MKIKTIALIVPLVLLLSGCMKLDGSAEINKSGLINGTFTYTLDKSDASLLDIKTIDDFKKVAEQGGSSCTTNQYLEDSISFTAICKYINASPGADKRISVETFIDKDGKPYYTIWYRQQGKMSPGSCWDQGKKDANGNAIVKSCVMYTIDQELIESYPNQLGSIKVVLKLPGQKAYIDWDKHGDTIGCKSGITTLCPSMISYDSDYEYVTIKGYWTDYINFGFVRDPNALNNRELREKAAAEKALAEAKAKAEAEAAALAKQLAEAQAKAKAEAELAAILKKNQDTARKLYSGKSCTKLNSIKIVAKLKFTCIKKNNKLVWNNGI